MKGAGTQRRTDHVAGEVTTGTGLGGEVTTIQIILVVATGKAAQENAAGGGPVRTMTDRKCPSRLLGSKMQ